MSLFGLSMGEFDDDLGIMSSHMNAMNMQMRSVNRLMNSLMPDPFNMLAPFDSGFQHQNAIMERGQPMAGMGGMGALFPAFPAMPNMNRLISADIGQPSGASFCSSSVISMSAGPDGRPQYYQATSSTKTGPGGVRETRKTVQDSRSGVKKMAIGHHIGERAHIIEKEQDLRSGQLEERQEFINLDEEEAEQFDREFINRAGRNGGSHMPRAIQAAPSNNSTLTIEPLDDSDDDETVAAAAAERQQSSQRYLPALPAPPTAPPAATSQHNRAATATTPTTTTRQRIVTPSATTTTIPAMPNINNDDGNYNNNYTPRRAHHYRSHLASPRRPLRTPSSSPLATTPTSTTSSITTAPSAAHHHHPYNNAAAARRQQRKSHSQQQQQQQDQFHLQGVQIPTTSQQQQQPHTSNTSRHSAGANSTVATKKSRH